MDPRRGAAMDPRRDAASGEHGEPGGHSHGEPERHGEPDRHGEPGGLRERKQARTRAELKAAADRLFDRRGFDAVTVEDICAEVEISPRTFFRYFHNKDEIVFEGIRPRLAQMVEAFANRPASEDAYQALCQALLSVAGDPDYQHELRWVHRLVSSSPELLGASLQHYRVCEDRLVDLVVARSFGPPAVTAECGAPFLKAGGLLVVSEPPVSVGSPSGDQGSVQPERWPGAALEQLGLRPVQLVGEPFAYQLLVQQRLCPTRFPRRTGVPTKRPLY